MLSASVFGSQPNHDPKVKGNSALQVSAPPLSDGARQQQHVSSGHIATGAIPTLPTGAKVFSPNAQNVYVRDTANPLGQVVPKPMPADSTTSVSQPGIDAWPALKSDSYGTGSSGDRSDDRNGDSSGDGGGGAAGLSGPTNRRLQLVSPDLVAYPHAPRGPEFMLGPPRGRVSPFGPHLHPYPHPHPHQHPRFMPPHMPPHMMHHPPPFKFNREMFPGQHPHPGHFMPHAVRPESFMGMGPNGVQPRASGGYGSMPQPHMIMGPVRNNIRYSDMCTDAFIIDSHYFTQ